MTAKSIGALLVLCSISVAAWAWAVLDLRSAGASCSTPVDGALSASKWTPLARLTRTDAENRARAWTGFGGAQVLQSQLQTHAGCLAWSVSLSSAAMPRTTTVLVDAGDGALLSVTCPPCRHHRPRQEFWFYE